jgi:translation elongation factor P/translation initiation factor 5A
VPPRQIVCVSISSNDFKPGVFIEVDGAPYRILGA